VEFHERLAPTPGADLPVGHDGVTGQRSAIGHPARQFAFVERGADTRHDPGAPTGMSLAVVPAIDCRPGESDATERYVVERKAQVFGGHLSTVPPGAPSPARCPGAYHHAMAERTNEEVIRTYLQALIENDAATLARLRDPDWTVDYPQSRERIRGHVNERAVADAYPGGVPAVDPGRVVGSEDRWVVTPSFTLERIAGGGDAWWSEGRVHYADGTTWYVASIYQLRAGRIHREVSYWAEPFDPPAWRAAWVEPIEPG
jgi:hypothetical protein